MRNLKNILLKPALLLLVLPFLAFGAGPLNSSPVLAAVKSHETTGWTTGSGYDNMVLNDVSCPDTQDCVAVGNFGTPGAGGNAVLSFTNIGSSNNVSPVSYYQGPGINIGSFTGVSCTTSDNCIAAGYVYDANGYRHPAYAIETNGSWGDVQQVDTPGGANNNEQFNSISCADANDCVAVGTDDYGASGVIPIYDTYSNGSMGTATEVTTPTGYGILYDVYCVDAGDCTAVGTDNDLNNNINAPIYLSMTSGTWGSINEFSSPDPTGSEINSLSCIDSTDCTAVGTDNDASTGLSNAVYSTETAGSWSPVTDIGQLGVGYMDGVSCVSTGNCTAVGWDDINGNPLYSVEQNGQWGSALPVTTAGTAFFNSVGCAQSSQSISCVAVGESQDGSLIDQPFGQSGSQQPSLSQKRFKTNSSSTKDGVLMTTTISKLPHAPTNVVASVPASGSVTVSWAAPKIQGSSNVRYYTVKADNGISSAVTCTTSKLTCTLPSLNSSTLYNISVSATNSAGTGVLAQAPYQIYPITASKADESVKPVVVLGGQSFNILAYGDKSGQNVKFSAQGLSYSCTVNNAGQCYVNAKASSTAGIYKATATIGSTVLSRNFYVPLLRTPTAVKHDTSFKISVDYAYPGGTVSATINGVTHSKKASSAGKATFTIKAGSAGTTMTLYTTVDGTALNARTIQVN